jgi:hypothetical protein
MEGTLRICEKAQAKLLICLRIRREKPKAVPTPKIAKGEGTAVDGLALVRERESETVEWHHCRNF